MGPAGNGCGGQTRERVISEKSKCVGGTDCERSRVLTAHPEFQRGALYRVCLRPSNRGNAAMSLVTLRDAHIAFGERLGLIGRNVIGK